MVIYGIFTKNTFNFFSHIFRCVLVSFTGCNYLKTKYYIMKANSLNFQKTAYFYSLHMKRKCLVSKNEKYFNFFKMDKKNVQN